MTGRTLPALAVADFRERSRRPAYLVTLAAAIALGYLALPPASSVWVVMNAGGYRGVYNSAYVGTVTALAGGLWLMIGGFYVVRGAIIRDEQAGVGQVLAATPLRSAGYLAGQVPQQPHGAGLHGRRAGGVLSFGVLAGASLKGLELDANRKILVHPALDDAFVR